MRLPLVAAVIFFAAACTAAPQKDTPNVAAFVVKDIDGHDVKLADYAGKVVLVVNVASECGFTPQYAGLESMYEKYQARGFLIIGFPSNDFGGQEPGTPDEIKKFTSEEFHVTFPLMAKISTKGDDIAPIYRELEKAGSVKWNFTKFLVDKKGNVVGHFPSKVTPESPELTVAIEKLLG